MQEEEHQQLGREVLDIYGAVCNRVLRIAEASLPATQFKAVRRLVLDEFGEQGAQKQVKQLFRLDTGRGQEWQGAGQGMEWVGASAKVHERGGDHS